MPEYLFTYGTPQIENVQIETFGRILKGKRDSLRGYMLTAITIKDKSVIMKSWLQIHKIGAKRYAMIPFLVSLFLVSGMAQNAEYLSESQAKECQFTLIMARYTQGNSYNIYFTLS